jgi:hypothetical protein
MEFAPQTCGARGDADEGRAHDRRSQAASAFCGRWASRSTAGLRHLHRDLESVLVTGNYMRPGTGAYPLRGHNNVQGASDHGSMPNNLPGYQSWTIPKCATIRGGVEGQAAVHQRAWTTTRWSTRSMRASSKRCICSAKR